MNDAGALGRMLLILGAVILVIGALLAFGPRIPWLGRLLGDFSFGGSGWRVYVPLGTSIVISVILTMAFWVFRQR
ncbi:MAG TPA: DUF2905 domain-containing protein [Candidatus Eisenbacteria bacterium]|nr:DUF2905 domain-containing protein [Candidatus Eisenbacteria bacterium]